MQTIMSLNIHWNSIKIVLSNYINNLKVNFVKKIIFFLCVLCVSIISCTNKKNVGMRGIASEQVKISLPDSFQANLAKKTEFIKLQEPKETFAEINSIQVFNDTIYLLDKYGRGVLMSFDKNGKYLMSFSSRGNAKNEYVKLWAFDVDKKYVYLYDRAKKKMMYFTHQGKIVKAQETRFRGDSFKVLANNKFLFSLALDKDLSKLCLVNQQLEIENILLSYTDKDKDLLANDNIFQKIGKEIIYSKEMNDTIYKFSEQGECMKSYCIDFLGLNVPKEYKYDFEKLLDDDKQNTYAYISDCPLVKENLLVLPVSNRGKNGVVYYDLSKKQILEVKNSNLPSFPPLCLWDDQIINVMDLRAFKKCSDKKQFPKDIIAFLQEGGRVLLKSHIEF